MFYFLSLIKKSESDVGIRMIDDGFAQICDMVNDLSMKVRTEAAGLLVGETGTNIHLNLFINWRNIYVATKANQILFDFTYFLHDQYTTHQVQNTNGLFSTHFNVFNVRLLVIYNHTNSITVMT